MMKTKCILFLGYIFIFVLNVLVPQFQTEHSAVCGKESSQLQCLKNGKINIHYVYWNSWQSKCRSAQKSNCHAGTDLIKNQCDTKNNCILEENYFNSCSKQYRHVDVKYYCGGWWPYSTKYLYYAQVCGSLSVIQCSKQYEQISEIVVLRLEFVNKCEIGSDVINCIQDTLKGCIGYRRCSYIRLINEKCFHLPLKSGITYSCNTEGTVLNTTTVKNNGNQGIIPTADVTQRTIVVDITKPPKPDEVKWILDLDIYSRLLIINQKRNITFSLCGNNWTNEYATIVCRHLKRSGNGIAGVIPRNTNISRIAYGLDCPVNVTNPFECKPDNTNASRDICNFTGDASVRCYSDTNSHFSDKTALTGIILGGILGFVFVLLIIVVLIICRRKRNKKENKRAGDEKRENASTTANYHRKNDMHDTGEQERVSLMIPTPQEAETQLEGGQYFVLDPGATGFNRSNKNYSEKDNEAQYATSSDGVYDVTNERRHIEKDEINIYSHTVDDVYDTSAHDRKGKERDNAYDDYVIQNDD